MFDNILVADDIEYAKKLAEETWGKHKDVCSSLYFELFFFFKFFLLIFDDIIGFCRLRRRHLRRQRKRKRRRYILDFKCLISVLLNLLSN